MTSLLALRDDRARADLQTLLRRGMTLSDGTVRFQAAGDVAMVAMPLTASTGLMDLTPTILGTRAFRLRSAAAFDAVVPMQAAIDALVAGAELDVPVASSLPAWAAVSPPREGWSVLGTLSADAIRLGATRARAHIERALPVSPGEAVVRKVQREVWSERLEALDGVISLGQCFAMDALGFLGAQVREVRITRCGSWTRVSTTLGDVLER